MDVLVSWFCIEYIEVFLLRLYDQNGYWWKNMFWRTILYQCVYPLMFSDCSKHFFFRCIPQSEFTSTLKVWRYIRRFLFSKILFSWHSSGPIGLQVFKCGINSCACKQVMYHQLQCKELLSQILRFYLSDIFFIELLYVLLSCVVKQKILFVNVIKIVAKF